MPTISDFQEKVYLHLLLIPPGQVTTYAAIAKALGSSPRAVGGALRCNPFAPAVPCHRVIASDGSIGGFKGEWRTAKRSTPKTAQPQLGLSQAQKLELLKAEGVEFIQDRGGKVKLKMLAAESGSRTSARARSGDETRIQIRTRTGTGATAKANAKIGPRRRNGRTNATTIPTPTIPTALESNSDTEETIPSPATAKRRIKSKYFSNSSSSEYTQNGGDGKIYKTDNNNNANPIWFIGPWDTTNTTQTLKEMILHV
ncbi:hypothetical protein A1O1_06862 [Capronia coronata CBS 617.96]|uniref:Methylated-DNA--protein-cysteine methyltransferase n=1 Tax=Capronia coronata CBS 617.96 TaxID=1182541 RepID=W9XSN1_9EURO|nr:uncharacterized protein A1O1_06862 [Capronia coronata CBS 617.96]EXJ83243.1 hypothetical protein A1O1_06862 [Capronia coronata CBS 617.96]